MVDNKTILLSAIIATLIAGGFEIAPQMFEGPQYYCESRPELGVVQCDSFSKYVDPNGKCVRNEDTNLICREGWVQVLEDSFIPEEIPSPSDDFQGEINYEHSGTQWSCSVNGCVCINNCKR